MKLAWKSLEVRPLTGPALVLLLVAASAAAFTLFGLRVSRTGRLHFAFLTWNLVLAWLPLCFACLAVTLHRRNRPRVLVAAALLVWVVLLPNAPYISTDFVHLRPDSRVPLWFDAALIGSFAATGLALGFLSVYLVQQVVAEWFGRRIVWAWVALVWVLTGVGIYMGRVLRLNSWDLAHHPRFIAGMVRGRLADPFGNPSLLVVTVAFAVLLLVGYVAFYAFVSARVAWRTSAGQRS